MAASKADREEFERRHTYAEERRYAIAKCPRCDEKGWRLGPDGLVTDDARRCDHADARATKELPLWTQPFPTDSRLS